MPMLQVEKQGFHDSMTMKLQKKKKNPPHTFT